MKRSKIKSILFQLVHKDNWRTVEIIDGWLYVYDRMPEQMRLCVGLRITGDTVKEISKSTKIHLEAVRTQLNRAKKRFAQILL